MVDLRDPIFIVGSRRSGTTLLQTMLNGHPDLIVHPKEPQFILELYQQFGFQISDVNKTADYVLSHPYSALEGEADEFINLVQENQPIKLGNFVRAYLTSWIGTENINSKVVLKHPRLVFYLDLVTKIFPNAYILNIVRDPRANIFSQIVRWPKTPIWRCITWWRVAVRRGNLFSDQHPSKTMSLRYEDLVLDAEKTLERICKFLDIPYSKSMLRFKLKTKSYSPKSSPNDMEYDHLDQDRINRWKRHLTPIEISLIEEACKQEMQWFGYQPSNPKVSATLRRLRYYWEISYSGLFTILQRIYSLIKRILGLHKIPFPFSQIDFWDGDA